MWGAFARAYRLADAYSNSDNSTGGHSSHAAPRGGVVNRYCKLQAGEELWRKPDYCYRINEHISEVLDSTIARMM